MSEKLLAELETLPEFKKHFKISLSVKAKGIPLLYCRGRKGRKETKKARIEKICPLIQVGKGLHDKYKK